MPEPKPLVVAFTGMLSLAVAMGIGRFAFTPLLPMMLHDGVVGLQASAWLATANYVGYWIGALLCAVQPRLWLWLNLTPPLAHTRAIKLGLMATVLLTLLMALGWGARWAWPLWRYLAGMASALVFVFASGWCLARLTALGAPALAGVIFMGPGLGIAISGLAASVMVSSGWSAAAGWLSFGALAAALTVLAWPHLRGAVAAPAASGANSPTQQHGGMGWFVLAYGLAGFGYIITATFLPVIARQALPGSVWLDLFWPLFGLAVAAGALFTTRLPVDWDRRGLLVVCYVMQALAVLLTVWWPDRVGFVLGSLLLGLPFTAITLFALQEARRLRPQSTSSAIAWLTASYGLGQIAGPPLVAALLQRSASTAAGFAASLQTAALALLVGALIFGLLLHHDRRADNS